MRRTLILLTFLLACLSISARDTKLFDDGWLFTLGDSSSMASVNYDDSQWHKLNIPHDWSIEGDFLASNPAGASGGALPGGIGWYRKHFTVGDEGFGKRYFIHFDGVYMNSSVYLNGHLLGTRPYGFIGFEYDMVPYMNNAGDNVLAVRVDNSQQPNCRWYSGSGIYRNVYLIETSGLRIDNWGVYTNASVKGNTGSVDITVNVTDYLADDFGIAVVRNSIVDASGKTVATKDTKINLEDANLTARQTLRISHPRLWTLTDPYIYKVKTELLVGGKTMDEQTTSIGLRTFAFDAKTGFWLNGVNMKLNGVCMHHDGGCLGAAVNEDALHRQLQLLKDMGCNAIRCSHNPPAPELLNMCDTMGFVVMDEAFDTWHRKKTQYDYARYFDEWFEQDLTDMVLRDRNHPSVMMWSIGNEVLEQWDSADADTLSAEQANLILNAGHAINRSPDDGKLSVNSLLTRKLADIVRSLDGTRPVTAACNEPSPDNLLFKSGALDIIGFNYHHEQMKDVPANFPGKPFMLTESVSALQTRGYYRMPSDTVFIAPDEWWKPYSDPSYMCSAYDNMRVPWGSTHEETMDAVKRATYCAGQFLWTGWDYIGEPTPYGFPARSSYFGVIDLAGFPKDSYYLYQSEWTDKPVLHLFPHWNWIDGQDVDVWCYYNQADEVELYVNGKSQGVRSKVDDHQYHVAWRTTFEPGELRVVARRGGKVVREETVKTAGTPDHIRLTADKTTLIADGKSLAFVTVEVVDKDNNVCPLADNQVLFDVDGGVTIAGVDNGNQTSMERFKDDKRKAFFGKCLAVVRSGKEPASGTLTAKAVGLKSASMVFTQKDFENIK